MRITKKSSSNLSIAQVISKINKRHQSSLNNQYQSGNKNDKIQKSFLLEKESLINGDPIKVQLAKNNLNKKVYSTKTIDYKTFYTKSITAKFNNNENNNFQIPKICSNNIQRQNFKFETETNNYIFNKANNNANIEKNNKYSDLGNIDRLKKYLIPKNNPYRNSMKMNRSRVISASPVPNNPYREDEIYNGNNNNDETRQNNQQPEHKMRDLLSQKFTYNKPKTTSTPNNIKKKPGQYDLRTYCNNNRSNNINKDNMNINSFNIKKENFKNNSDNLSVISYDESSPIMINKKIIYQKLN
jgi:hypothetical protein